MTFHVGQKVVCVDDRLHVSVKMKGWFDFLRPWERLDHNLNRGDVYVVTRVTMRRTESGHIVQLLLVDGARHFRFPDIGFPSFQFRPLIEKKTDISVFTAMLDPRRKAIETV